MNGMENLTRRDFLKILALYTVSSLSLPGFEIAPAVQTDQQAGAERLPNILILLFDTLSAKHLSLYGYRRATTPNLARFAERATVFHQHFSAGNFTMPGTASLLTGAYPWSHRGLHYFGTVRDDYVDRNIFSALAADYYISAFTHNSFALGLLDQFRDHLDLITPAKDLAVLSEPLTEELFPNDYTISFWGERLLRASGSDLPGSLFLSFLGKDFDTLTPEDLKREYENRYPRGIPNNTHGLFFLLEESIDWIRNQMIDLPRPFLGYFHLFPPHEPYAPRRDFIDLFNDGWSPKPKPSLAYSLNRPEEFLVEKRRHYDEYIAFMDAEFGRLYDSLDQAGVLEDTYFIVTSDHGQLFERGIHGHVTSTLYQPLVHVPLLISKPGQKEREDIFAPTSCVDLLPTLMHIAGKPAPDWCEGQVLPTFSQAKPDHERSIYALEAKENPKSSPIRTGTASLIKGRYKLIQYLGFHGNEDGYEFYDLENDPEEYENIDPSGNKFYADLKEELGAKLEAVNREFEENQP